MNEIYSVMVTGTDGSIHIWDNAMWSIASDDTLLIYGLTEVEFGSPKSYKVAQFAKGSWAIVEVVLEVTEEDEISD